MLYELFAGTSLQLFVTNNYSFVDSFRLRQAKRLLSPLMRAKAMAERVRLNIYDMYWVNDYLFNLGIGVYHSGVEVYGAGE